MKITFEISPSSFVVTLIAESPREATLAEMLRGKILVEYKGAECKDSGVIAFVAEDAPEPARPASVAICPKCNTFVYPNQASVETISGVWHAACVEGRSITEREEADVPF